MRIRASWILLCATFLVVPGQLHAEVGTAVVFLLLPPGARANGMGQGFVAVADDATAGYYNPGGLALLPEKEDPLFGWPIEWHYMHSPWMPVFDIDDLYLRYYGFIQHVSNLGTVAFSRQYLNVGDVLETDSEGNELGTFRVWDEAINMTYSVSFFRLIGIGFTMKEIRSQLHPDAGVGISRATDVGLLLRVPDIKLSKGNATLVRSSFGISLSNRGDGISYRPWSPSDPLPELLRIGISGGVSFSEQFRILLCTELNKVMVNEKEDDFWAELAESKRCIGSEFEYRIPRIESVRILSRVRELSLCLRMGYYYDREDRNIPEGFTFGTGIGFDIRYSTSFSPLRLQFDFASVEPPEDFGDEHTKMYSFSVSL
jgi:hypothetical protein